MQLDRDYEAGMDEIPPIVKSRRVGFKFGVSDLKTRAGRGAGRLAGSVAAQPERKFQNRARRRRMEQYRRHPVRSPFRATQPHSRERRSGRGSDIGI